MMTVEPIKMSIRDAAGYYSSAEMKKEDYYTSKEEAAGTWSSSAASLGLTGEVTEEQLLSVFNGQHFSSGKALIGKGGKSALRSPGWDATFSVPKSISALWASAAASGDKELQDKISSIIDQAVEKSMDRVVKESLKGSVRRVEYDEKTGTKKERYEDPLNVPYAKFHHRTSRLQQPNLHVHVIIPNMAQRKDGSWGALKVSQYIGKGGKSDGGSLFKDKMLNGSIFRAELSHLLQKKLGVECDRDRDFFRAREVPEELEKHWSKRREQIEQALKERGLEGGKAAAKAALLTREKKTNIDEKSLFEDWGREIKEMGLDTGFVKDTLDQFSVPESKEEIIESILSTTKKRITEQNSTFTERELKTHLAVESQTFLSVEEIKQAYQTLKNDQEIIELGVDNSGEARFTTKSVREIEESVENMATALKNRSSFSVEDQKIEDAISNASLFPTQEKAARNILTNSDFQLIEGAPGTGKSHVLGVTKQAFEADGYNVHAIAPTGKVAGDLKKDLNLEATTIDRFLFDAAKDRIAENQVLLVDEAGMIGSQKMHGIFSVAMEKNLKVVLVGDEFQLPSIEFGGAFGALKKDTPGNENRITSIIRQNEDWAREAVEAFGKGDAFEALGAYDSRGLLNIRNTNEQVLSHIAKDYVEAISRKPAKEVLALAQKNADVDILNSLIRCKLQDMGQITNSREVNLRTRNNKEFKSELGQGERIMFTRNDKRLGVTNGEMGVFLGESEESSKKIWSIEKDSGEILKIDSKRYNYLRQAHAVTNYKSQGTTVNETLIALGPSTSRVDSHVIMSRHREKARIYVAKEQWVDVRWQEFKGNLTKDEKNNVELKNLYNQMVKRVSWFAPKETSLNWEQKFLDRDSKQMVEEQVYCTPQIKERVEKIAALPIGKEIVNELFQLTQTPPGVQNKWMEPLLDQSSETPWQKQANRMLSKFDFTQESRNALLASVNNSEKVESLDSSKSISIFGVEAIRSERIEKYRTLMRKRFVKKYSRAYTRAARFESEYSTPELVSLVPQLDEAKKLDRDQRIQVLKKVAILPRGMHREDDRFWNQALTKVQIRAEKYLEEGKLDTKRLKQLGRTISAMPIGRTPEIWTGVEQVTEGRNEKVTAIAQKLQSQARSQDISRGVEGASI